MDHETPNIRNHSWIYHVFLFLSAICLALTNYLLYQNHSRVSSSLAFTSSAFLLFILLEVFFIIPILRYVFFGGLILMILIFNGIHYAYHVNPISLVGVLIDTTWSELSAWFHWSYLLTGILWLGITAGYIKIIKLLEPLPHKLFQNRILINSKKSLCTRIPICAILLCSILFALRYVYFFLFPLNTLLTTSPTIKFNSWYPLSIVYEVSTEAIQFYFKEANKLLNLPDSSDFDSVCTNISDELIFVFVIGETSMASHASINGYTRNTTPFLIANQTNIVSFPHTLSFGHMTNTSIVGMFTNAEINHPSPTVGNFTDLFSKYGFSTYYYSSSGEMRNQNILMRHLEKKTFPSAKNVFDAIAPSSEKKRSLYVVYTEGSHFPYNERYPKEWSKFKPDNHSSYPPENPSEKLINAYDNSILYMDFLLGSLIERLKEKRAVIFFSGDHGELFGENGLYGRNDNPTFNGRKPLIFIWLSDKYIQTSPGIMKNIESWKESIISHDYIFHTALGLGSIISPHYKPNMDLTLPKEREKQDIQPQYKQ